MSYITREDGEHFVIPSYRDVLAAKNKTQLKKDILLLSQSYGEYITLQSKGPNQYEVAFSPDTGYLLGESVWQYFKRPLDMIYCEAIPNTTEAILVIVKSGSVYLDGSFPLESIPEELVIFLTQQNHFEIYTYGDVPISEIPIDGKFSFEPDSVKSFTVLDKPVFPTLPLMKIYQLQLVDQVLKAHGIGVFPVKQLATIVGLIAFIWFFWEYVIPEKKIIAPPPPQVNPYQAFNDALASPAPDQDMNQFLNLLKMLFTMPPGWQPASIKYADGTLVATVKSSGNTTKALFDWAQQNNANIDIKADGVYVSMKGNVTKRPVPTKIYPIKQVLSRFVDDLASVYPGNHLALGNFANKQTYTDVILTINFTDASPVILGLIGEKMKDMPFVLQNVTMTVSNETFSGSITLEALGS